MPYPILWLVEERVTGWARLASLRKDPKEQASQKYHQLPRVPRLPPPGECEAVALLAAPAVLKDPGRAGGAQRDGRPGRPRLGKV
jgi:hypothetical protein